MLSRPARAMFDLGRHVERADASARLLDAHLALVDATGPDARLLRSLVSLVGGTPPPGPVDRDGLLHALAYDPTSPVSVLGAWSDARADARAAREVLPAQVLEVMTATRAAMPDVRWRANDTAAFFAWVRERTAVVVGALEATAPRDEGWHFLVLGRQLERASATAALAASTTLHDGALAAGLAVGTGAHRSGRRSAASLPPVWHEVLRAAGTPTVMAVAATTVAAAAHLVLVERRWPRSVVASLVAAEEALDALAAHGVTPEALETPRHRVARARTELEYRPVDELLGDLGGVAARVERTAAAAAAGVEHAALAADEPTRWLVHAG